MKKPGIYLQAYSGSFVRIGLIALLIGLAVMVWGCGGESESSSGESTESSADAQSGGDVQNSGASSQDSGQDSGAGSGSDTGVVVHENPGAAGTALDYAPNAALDDSQPIDAVNWTLEPFISAGALEASGELQNGAMVFEPMIGEGAAFSVFYKGHEDPLVVILPDMGPMQIWETTHTVAEMDYELSGGSFTLTAYSPLFMNPPGPGELEMRVYGFDGNGAHALLSVHDVGDSPIENPSVMGGAPSGGGMDGSAISQKNPGALPTFFNREQNDALAGAQPIDAVTWTVGPFISAGALEAEGKLEQESMLFSPMMGEGAAFAVFYKGHDEPTVVLLPDLGPMEVWDTDLTVAPMEYELDGDSFKFRAYSPLFMDTGPGDLELRAYGFDQNYKEVLLSVQEIGLQ